MSADITISVVTGKQTESYIRALAWLRTTVFHEFPYLYQGSDEYEQQYLKTYTNHPESVFVLASDKNKIIGAASGIPLSGETEEVRQAFIKHGIPLENVFYFGESVLLPSFRGQGIGKSFIQEREKAAKSLGYQLTSFCGVVRPEDHHRRPESFIPLDGFWRKMGYKKKPGMTTTFEWQDLDENKPSPKEMQFWLKQI